MADVSKIYDTDSSVWRDVADTQARKNILYFSSSGNNAMTVNTGTNTQSRNKKIGYGIIKTWNIIDAISEDHPHCGTCKNWNNCGELFAQCTMKNKQTPSFAIAEVIRFK